MSEINLCNESVVSSSAASVCSVDPVEGNQHRDTEHTEKHREERQVRLLTTRVCLAKSVDREGTENSSSRDFVAGGSVKTEARAHPLPPLAVLALFRALDLRQHRTQRLAT
jgi:hypothetical protein